MTAHNPQPTQTPNVVVSNPQVRKVANVVLGVAGLVLGSVVAYDLAAQNVDFSEVTGPLIAVYGFVAGAFGLAVTTPNIPTK